MSISDERASTVDVRPARRRDIDALLEIERQCFNVPHYGYFVLERQDFEGYLEEADCVFLVALIGKPASRPVGYVLGPAGVRRNPLWAHIDSIAVRRDVRRQGAGSLLLRSFIAEARRRGCRQVALEVSPANEAGMAFFARHGLRTVRRLPHYYGRNRPGLLMATRIQHEVP